MNQLDPINPKPKPLVPDELRDRVVRCLLNLERVKRLGWWINDDGERVVGDVANQQRLLEFDLERLGREVMAAASQCELDPEFKRGRS